MMHTLFSRCTLCCLGIIFTWASSSGTDVWSTWTSGSRKCDRCTCKDRNISDTYRAQADCRNISLQSVEELHLPSNISILLLAHNNLSSLDGLQSARYPRLTYLDVSFNVLEHIVSNDTKTKLPPHVSTLFLSHNNFTRINDFEFSHFPHLTKLDLSYNFIEEMTSNGFANLTNLTLLNLENNTLDSSSFPNAVFSRMQNLKTLKLNNNTLTEYPQQALSQLASLEELFIDGLYGAEFGPDFQKLTKLSHLVLSGGSNQGKCNISVLRNSTFDNLFHLEHLDISGCSITEIDNDTFTHLERLQSLDISSNKGLGLSNFFLGMCGLPYGIQVLKANNIVHKLKSCVIITKDHIRCLNATSLTHLYLDDNSIENIELGAIPLLPRSLTFISAQRNKFSYGLYLKDLGTMTNLTEVILSGVSYPINVPDYDPSEISYCDSPQCDGEAEVDIASSEFQSRGVWYEDTLGTSRFGDFPQFNLSVPPNLKKITCNFTQLTFTIGRVRFESNVIDHLDLSSNLVQFQNGQLLGLEKVTYIDLSNNLARKMSSELLVNCRELVTLNISFNFFGWQLQNDTEGKIFKNLTKLKNLIISNNDLKELKNNVFRDLYALEMLNISSNGMYGFRPDMTHMTNLTLIDASSNQIKFLQPETMKQLTEIKKKSSNFTFILRNNPLSSDCQDLDTLTWLLNSKVTPKNMSGYFCLVNNTRRYIKDQTDFRDLVEQITSNCKNNFGLALGCVAIFFAAMGLMAGSLLYRYRWKLRYLYYAARLRYLAENSPEEEDDDFVFDAFISYADEDRGFVINDMRSRLEHEASMALNIHHRDFMPGEPIVSNIVGAIKKSRKTLVLLSKNFLKSYWCKYELHMAQMESISTGRDIIIIIMFESVPAKNIPPEFLHLLQSDSYIEYPHDESNKDIFWTHLTRALRHRTR